MTRGELGIAVDWAAAQGWNPGLHDADCFHAADPGGFLVGLLGEEPIATISVVKYGATFGFLGFYIVKPEYRGQGYGVRIWNAGLAYLEGRVVGLDGVVDQQENYRKSGFLPAYRNVRYEGMARGGASRDEDIVALSTLAFDEVCSYDRPFFPDSRARFLRCWIGQPQAWALGFVRNDALAGYGVVRACRSGYKVGPLFADEPEIAESLFAALQEHVPGGAPVFLDAPATNAAAVELAKRHGMTAIFETARMYAGECPKLPIERTFGVTTFELG
jgi:GNAT superfamily N-acetyltransferase